MKDAWCSQAEYLKIDLIQIYADSKMTATVVLAHIIESERDANFVPRLKLGHFWADFLYNICPLTAL